MGLASSIHMPVDTEPLTGLHRGLTAMVGVAIEIDTIGVEMTGVAEFYDSIFSYMKFKEMEVSFLWIRA